MNVTSINTSPANFIHQNVTFIFSPPTFKPSPLALTFHLNAHYDSEDGITDTILQQWTNQLRNQFDIRDLAVVNLRPGSIMVDVISYDHRAILKLLTSHEHIPNVNGHQLKAIEIPKYTLDAAGLQNPMSLNKLVEVDETNTLLLQCPPLQQIIHKHWPALLPSNVLMLTSEIPKAIPEAQSVQDKIEDSEKNQSLQNEQEVANVWGKVDFEFTESDVDIYDLMFDAFTNK